MVRYTQGLRYIPRNISDTAHTEIQVPLKHRCWRNIAQSIQTVLHEVSKTAFALPILLKNMIVDVEERIAWQDYCGQGVQE